MRQFIIALVIFASVILVISSILFLVFIDTRPMGRFEYINTTAVVTAFKYIGFPKPNDVEVKFLYNNSCTRRCHGREVVENAKHTPREWEDIVSRMRLVNGAKLTNNTMAAVTKYLQKNYSSNVPTILSPQANRFLKNNLWRSDFGESDLYVDVIYAPNEYFKLMGGIYSAEEHDVDSYTVFFVYLNTHQEKLPKLPLEKMAVLKDKNDRVYEPIDYKIVYDSFDFHHREGVLRFKKIKGDDGFIELALIDLPGQKQRLFRWDLPLPEFKEE